jgi:hypothetical protein
LKRKRDRIFKRIQNTVVRKQNIEFGQWQDVATAIETESTLVEQPLKTELEYRIIAINKSGEGSPSNTVMVVL